MSSTAFDFLLRLCYGCHNIGRRDVVIVTGIPHNPDEISDLLWGRSASPFEPLVRQVVCPFVFYYYNRAKGGCAA